MSGTANCTVTVTQAGLGARRLLITTDLCRSRSSLPKHKPSSTCSKRMVYRVTTPVEHNRSGSALGYSSLFDVRHGQLHRDRNTGRPRRPTSVDHNRSLSLQEQPSQTQTIVNLLKEDGLSRDHTC